MRTKNKSSLFAAIIAVLISVSLIAVAVYATTTIGNNVIVGGTLDVIGNLELENTISTSTGVIYKGGETFIHNFQHPTGDTAPPKGGNTFVGINAGNFTMGSTVTPAADYLASYNTAVGYGNLQANTTGYSNTAIGYRVLYNNTSGSLNVGLGTYVLTSNTTGSGNSGIGYGTLSNNTTGTNNTAIGSAAGNNITTGSNNLIIGYDADAPSATGDNQLNIGNVIYGDLSSGNVGIGTTSPATSALLELSSTVGALLLTRMTTTSRDALTPVDGMILYNSTENRIEAYENGYWIELIPSSYRFTASTSIAYGTHEGKPAKIISDNTVDLCADGDRFHGIIETIANDSTTLTLRIRGLVTVVYTGTAPTAGIVKLSADASGGVKIDAANGIEKFVISVNIGATTVTFDTGGAN